MLDLLGLEIGFVLRMEGRRSWGNSW